MVIGPNGFVYSDEPEMIYNLLNAMGLSTRSDGIIIDPDNGGAIIQMGGKYVKASTDINNIRYAGNDEIMFEPITNNRLITIFLSVALKKYTEENGIDAISYFPEENIDANENRINRFGIRWGNGTTYYSSYYYNRCLPIVETIFMLGEIQADLHNFDSIEPRE